MRDGFVKSPKMGARPDALTNEALVTRTFYEIIIFRKKTHPFFNLQFDFCNLHYRLADFPNG
jgi:hypothetical protein